MWFNGTTESKILSWRDFRNSLHNWPDDLSKVANAWLKAPRVNHYLCSNNTADWPDAWELITNNTYCELAVSLGMFYTLYYSDYPQKDSLKLVGFRLKKSHADYNLLLCEQGKYVLNYSIGAIVNIQCIPTEAEIIYTITAQQLKF